MTRLAEAMRDYRNALSWKKRESKDLSDKIKEMRALGGLHLPSLEAIHEADQLIFAVPNYALATEVEIVEKIDNDYKRSDFSKLWNIAYSFIPEGVPVNGIRIYCRHKNWEQDQMRFVAYEYTRLNRGLWVITNTMGPDLDALTAFYKQQGVKPELLKKMGELVASVRDSLSKKK